MAFIAFVPASVALTGNDALIEGVDYLRTFTVKTGSPAVATNMGEWDASPPVIVFKNAVTETQGSGTAFCPVGVCAWTSSAGGEFTLTVTASNTNAGTGQQSGQKFTGVYEIVVTFEADGRKAMIFKGEWNITQTAYAA